MSYTYIMRLFLQDAIFTRWIFTFLFPWIICMLHVHYDSNDSSTILFRDGRKLQNLCPVTNFIYV